MGNGIFTEIRAGPCGRMLSIELRTLVASSADCAVQNCIGVSGGFTQQIAAVGAENQGTNDRHNYSRIEIDSNGSCENFAKSKPPGSMDNGRGTKCGMTFFLNARTIAGNIHAGGGGRQYGVAE